LSKFLNKNQIQFLMSGKTPSFQWSDETVKKLLAILHKSVYNSYKFIRKQGFPLTSYSLLM
jgi:hypothetical protein